MIDLEIDKMRTTDLDEVMAIEMESFNLPWSRGLFEREMANKENSYFLVARNRNEVVGYVGFWMIGDEAHIVNIAVRSDYQRRHVGSVLLASALNLAERLGAEKATLEVRVSNLPAQKLYTKFGFEMVAIRRNFYSDNNEDAYVMWIYNLKEKMGEVRALIRKIVYGEGRRI
ncbi:ribosomal-protein-alanine N-acetyltransferase [Candidatus Poribacteria bacterium]|nr:ribosomal-protein-alanine N-acetyltransferase [Candidatus Poribacteria bacterium]